MTHIESITKFFVVLTGFAALLGIYLFSNKLSNRIVKYYFYSYMSLFLYHVVDLIYRYISITFSEIELNILLCFTTSLYFIICAYVINVIKLTSEIIGIKRSKIVNLICNTVIVLYATIYMIAISKGDVIAVTENVNRFLWSYGMFIFFLTFIISFFLLWKKYNKLSDKVTQTMIKAFSILMLFYLPFTIFDNIIANIISWYPLNTDLRTCHFFFIIWNFISCSILSKAIYRLGNVYQKLNLTRREKEVFDLLINNEPISGIGNLLYISPRTVEKHISNIYIKIGVKSRVELLKKVKPYSLE